MASGTWTRPHQQVEDMAASQHAAQLILSALLTERRPDRVVDSTGRSNPGLKALCEKSRRGRWLVFSSEERPDGAPRLAAT